MTGHRAQHPYVGADDAGGRHRREAGVGPDRTGSRPFPARTDKIAARVVNDHGENLLRRVALRTDLT